VGHYAKGLVLHKGSAPHPTPYTLHPSPRALSLILQPAPYTLHPTPYTLHLALYFAPSLAHTNSLSPSLLSSLPLSRSLSI